MFPGLPSNAKLIINVANMNSDVKGQSALIEASKEVCAVEPAARFILVGDGPCRVQFEEQVRKLGVSDHFQFLGSRKDVPKILSCGDLFAFPSFAEGLPNAVLEASSAGLPIVATMVGGVPEIIEDGVTGLLVPPKNPQALSAAILQLLKDPVLPRNLLVQARNGLVHSSASTVLSLSLKTSIAQTVVRGAICIGPPISESLMVLSLHICCRCRVRTTPLLLPTFCPYPCSPHVLGLNRRLCLVLPPNLLCPPRNSDYVQTQPAFLKTDSFSMPSAEAFNGLDLVRRE